MELNTGKQVRMARTAPRGGDGRSCCPPVGRGSGLCFCAFCAGQDPAALLYERGLAPRNLWHRADSERVNAHSRLGQRRSCLGNGPYTNHRHNSLGWRRVPLCHETIKSSRQSNCLSSSPPPLKGENAFAVLYCGICQNTRLFQLRPASKIKKLPPKEVFPQTPPTPEKKKKYEPGEPYANGK